MQVYDVCSLCNKWDDLTKWRDVTYVCMECANELDHNAPYIQGKYKLNNVETFERIRNGKTST